MGQVMGPKSIGTRMVCGRSMGGGSGKIMMPLDGDLSGMDKNSAAWLPPNEELYWVLNKGLRPSMHAKTHMRGG